MKLSSLLILLSLIVEPARATRTAQEEEVVLGRPSAIQPSNQAQETLALEAGTRLREQPRFDSPVLELLDTPLELPVLDRHGSWVKVRFGVWQGWVHPGGSGTESGHQLPLSFEPDDEGLLRARSLLGEDVEPRSLGPFTLYTDVADEGLLEWLSAVAWDVLRAYRERFGLDPGSQMSEAVVVFAEETDYRVFEAAEVRIAEAHSRGYTSEGLSVLFSGPHDKTSLASVLIHELTHLLNRRAFRATTPPWLEEGMAEDLAFCRVTDQGLLRLGTLAGESSQDLGDTTPTSGPQGHLEALVAAWPGPNRPDLESLVAMDWQDFIEPRSRAIHYAASAMLLRYFSDGGDESLRQAYLQYLAAVAETELAGTVSLWSTLETGPEQLETGLYRFVLRQARESGIQ